MIMLSGAIHAVLLAAGQSRRMGERNKLLICLDGEPMVRRTARLLLAAEPASVVVVTGYMHEQVERALQGLDLHLAHNPDFASGLSGSLRTGLHALPAGAAAALIALADMPALETLHFQRLMVAFAEAGGETPVRAAHEGVPGNPVILPGRLFGKACAGKGDRGARDLLRDMKVVLVETGPAALRDLDTPEDLKQFVSR